MYALFQSSVTLDDGRWRAELLEEQVCMRVATSADQCRCGSDRESEAARRGVKEG